MYKRDLDIEVDEYGNNLICIGWLDDNNNFPKGEGASELFSYKLWGFCQHKFNSKRGFHACEYCDLGADSIPSINWEGELLKFGYSEIRVFSQDGKVYSAPNLIFHYIMEHNYAPPQEFVDAVMHGPRPASYEYYKLVGNLMKN